MSGQNKKIKKDVDNINLNDADDLWADVAAEDGNDYEDQEMYGLDDHLYESDQSEEEGYYDDGEEYDDSYYDDEYDYGDLPPYEEESTEEAGAVEYAEEDEEEYVEEEAVSSPDVEEEIPAPEEEVSITSEQFVCSAILEHIGGIQQEAAKAKFFEPQENTIVILDEEDQEEQILFFEQLSCIRLSSLPTSISDKQQQSGQKEIVETIDGKSIKAFVLSKQDIESALLCLSREEDSTNYPAVLFPTSSIKNRTEDRQLSDILLEKRLISKSMLQKALQEVEHVRNITLETVISQKAHIPVEQIEGILKEGREGPFQGMPDEEILLFSGVVNEDIILEAVAHLDKFKKIELDQFLIHKGIVGEKQVYTCLAELHKIPFIDLKGRKFSKNALTSLPQGMIRNYRILPIAKKDETLIIATYLTDISHFEQAINKAAKCKDIRYALSPPSQIKQLIRMMFSRRK